MKHVLDYRCLVLMGFAVIGIFASRPALAQAVACPEVPPEDAIARREAARQWFSRAETAENSGQDAVAIHAYACSMKIIPHASTAYNLARAAEKGGDLELAANSYRRYLALEPEARDRTEILAQIEALDVRVAAGRQPLVPTVPLAGATSPRAASPSGPPVAGAAIDQPTAADSSPDGRWFRRMGALEWTVAGAGVAALAGGVVLNLGARSKMEECRTLASAGALDTARERCDAAKPAAYASYALFGTAVAAAVVDLFLVWRNPRGVSVNVALAPHGATLSLSTRL
jgi:tetratricopeptide (TPR) repeat protein